MLRHRLLSLLLLSAVPAAQFSAIPPFEGNAHEAWSTQPDVGITKCLTGGAFGGAAEVCSTLPGGFVVLTDHWPFVCAPSPLAGDRFLGADGEIRLSFDPPVHRFGGYFATNGGAGSAEIDLFTFTPVNGEDTFALSGCGWVWAGWESELPLHQVRIRSDLPVGGFLLMDALELGRHFVAYPPSLSASAGGVQTWEIDAGAAHGFETYLVLGSAGGTSPGVAIDGHLLPLVPDAYTAFTLAAANGPILVSSFGALDAAGRASAGLHLPPGSSPALVGLELHHAYVTIGGAPAPEVTLASNALPVTVDP